MADKTTGSVATPVKAPPKAATIKKMASKPKSVKTHPSTALMVPAAIQALHERGGSSLRAIKKYIAGTYKLDTEKLAPFIKRYIKTAVVAGDLVQTKGKGASGSFKLPINKKVDTSETKKVSKKPAATKKTVDSKKTTKKAVTNKKEGVKATKKVEKATKTTAANKPKKAPAKSATKVAKAVKSPSKAKKVTKAPTTKPKAPKPKKIAGSKASSKKSVSKK